MDFCTISSCSPQNNNFGEKIIKELSFFTSYWCTLYITVKYLLDISILNILGALFKMKSKRELIEIWKYKSVWQDEYKTKSSKYAVMYCTSSEVFFYEILWAEQPAAVGTRESFQMFPPTTSTATKRGLRNVLFSLVRCIPPKSTSLSKLYLQINCLTCCMLFVLLLKL